MDIKYIIPKIIKKTLNRPAINESVVDKTSKIDVGSVVFGSTLGRYSYLGEHTSLIKTTVGNFTCISNYCAIGGGQHPVDWVSMSPVFNSSKGIIKKKFAQLDYNPYQTTEIGNDVWIGSHCLIKAGVKIADGAVIGMGSVVTKDVGAYEIWAGNPAKLIKKRFDDKTIESLEKTQWWTWDDEKVEKFAEDFNNPEGFLNCGEK